MAPALAVRAQLAAEVHNLAQHVEHAAVTAAQNNGGDALAKLEMRLSALIDGGRSVPPELQEAIHSLSERIDRMQAAPGSQLSHSDQLVLAGLEDRIVKLAEKLDASDQRLNNLASMERGIADLLVMLEEMRNGSRGLRANAVPAEEAPVPQPAPPPPAPVAVAPPAPLPQQHLPPVHHLEAPKAPDHVFSSIPAAPAAQPVAKQAPPRPQDRTPIDANLPPDTPLEPGAGMPRIKPGSPAARSSGADRPSPHRFALPLDPTIRQSAERNRREIAEHQETQCMPGRIEQRSADHRHDQQRDEDVAQDPARAAQEVVHRGRP